MADFEQIDELRDGGVVARLTSRTRSTGFVQHTFSLGREFERAGVGTTEQSKFITEEQLPNVRRLLDAIEARFIEERNRLHAERREARR